MPAEKPKKPYSEHLKAEMSSLIDTLDLSDLQKRFLRSRWLDQVVWMEGKTAEAQKWYYLLRLTSIVGGVIIPALVSLEISSGEKMGFVQWVTFIISLLVAISLAIEEFFNYGERWRHYRRTVESLKIEGWEFFQLSGGYKDFQNHNEAYQSFAARVEDILRHDVDAYISEVVREKKKENVDVQKDKNELSEQL
jgi:hypothetical protein